MNSKEEETGWFQDGGPNSYKIQVGYLDIPKHLIKTKFVDTPYRFSSFEDANKIAATKSPIFELIFFERA